MSTHLGFQCDGSGSTAEFSAIVAAATEARDRLIVKCSKETILLAADLAAGCGIIALALMLAFPEGVPAFHSLPYLTFLPLLIAWRVAMAYRNGLYDFRHRLTIIDHFFGACGAALASVIPGYMFLALIRLYYAPIYQLSRRVVLLDLLLLALWFTLSRVITLLVLRMRNYRVGLVVIGPGDGCGELIAELREYAPAAIDVKGVVALEEGPVSEEVIGTIDDFEDIVQQHKIDQAIVFRADLTQERLSQLLAQSDASGCEFFLYPDLDFSILASTRVISIAGLPVVSMQPGRIPAPYAVVKRGLDFSVAITLLIVLLPFIAAIAVAIKLTSKGPVFYSQQRLGRLGHPFNILKFRTMVVGAEDESGPTLSPMEDARITGIGLHMRRWRVDEIPQLWNIVLGHMSLVGPRPERAEFSQKFTEENPIYERRMVVKPGLTGLAQIHGRYDSGYAHKLRYDLIYLNSMSLATDLRILISTMRTVLMREGSR